MLAALFCVSATFFGQVQVPPVFDAEECYSGSQSNDNELAEKESGSDLVSNHGHGASRLSHDFKAANHEGIDTKAMVLKKDPGVDVPTPQMMQSLKT